MLICQARAAADGRLAVGRFSDPVAWALLRDDEKSDVEIARGPIPKGWSDRWTYEFLMATAEIVAARTVAIDDAIRECHHRQLVVLGAGLDARAWRLRELSETTVFEVDHPETQQDKTSRVEGMTLVAENVEFVPVDFGRHDLRTALAGAGVDPSTPTTWIWEGVMPYLTESQVRATLADIRATSAPGSRLVATYPTQTVINGVVHVLLKGVFALAGRRNPMSNERHVSAWSPAEMRALLSAEHLAVVSDVDQLTLAKQLGIDPRRPEQLERGRVVVAEVLDQAL